MVIRVCVIGAGPSGMGLLSMFNKLRDQGHECHVTCFEKQDTPGGLWNLTWRTGTDQHGETVHCSQYKDLFSNGPKECIEFADYTFKDHFGKPVPSFPPREVLFDYLQGYWRFHGVKNSDVLTSHIVRNVKFDEGSELFTVRVTNLITNEDIEQQFDRLVVATGHFSVPNTPHFDGIEKFEGRVIHAHDFKDAREFAGQRVMLIGSSYSAEDIAMQLYKFGVGHVTVSYRKNKMGFKWPEKIHEVPIVTKIEGRICDFKDGRREKFDVIILCTGYRHHFPFMPSELRLPNGNILFLPNLYRNLQWYGLTEGSKDAGGKLFYIAMQEQAYTFTMFMMQSLWVVNVIKGLHEAPDRETCVEDIEKMLAVNATITDAHKLIDGQTAYVLQLADDVSYTEKLDCADLFKAWVGHKQADILTYRDKSHQSRFTGEVSPCYPLPWVKCFDDTLEGYMSLVEE